MVGRTMKQSRDVARRVYIALIPHRFIINVGLDSLSWTFGLIVALILRYDLHPTGAAYAQMAWTVPLAIGLQFLVGLITGLYLGRWAYGSFEEVAAIVKSVAVVGVLLYVLNLGPYWVPRTVVVTAAVMALVLMVGIRYAWRLIEERHRRPSATANRLLVFGAGGGGQQVITSMLRDPSSSYLPVAIIDDDPRKQQLRVRGVPVLGTRADLDEIVDITGADTLLVAIPSASAALLREVSDQAASVGLRVRVLPSVGELFDGEVGETDIRPPTMSDLLGRREIDTDLPAIAHYLSGKRVLVTGAGGSIGSELCCQIDQFSPAALVMLDRDESALHGVQLSITGRALLDDPNLVVCDIRDRERVFEVFDRARPDVVFHAAALKHLPLLESHPSEALKTNVRGTQNVLDAAVRCGVTHFVNVSTDKAANPTSVLGFTKRITERLTAGADEIGDGHFLSVRFGNVLGSRGSVLTTFQEQIRTGGPVTVTHPDVTRYFMTVEEAVQLVIQAGAIGHGGEVLVLDMGEPVRIYDVARRMVEQTDRRIEIVITGLRASEKLDEELFATGETARPSRHPLINAVDVVPLDGGLVGDIDTRQGDEALIRQMARLSSQQDHAALHSSDIIAD